MNIEFVTFIGRNSADYAEYLKYYCEKLKSGKHNILYKCVESVGPDRIPKGFECLAKTGDVNHNSMNHALALNEAQKHIKEDYIIFIDADVVILYPGWDEVIIEELNKFHCFGGAYAHGSKYKNFPTVYLFAFRKEVIEKQWLDFSPKLIDNTESVYRYSINTIEATYFNMKVGDVIKCDTGWSLPLQFNLRDFTSNYMPMILMNDKKSLLPFKDKAHEKFCNKKPSHMHEWHYNGKLFATHKQASRNHEFNGIYGLAWRERVEMYVSSIWEK